MMNFTEQIRQFEQAAIAETDEVRKAISIELLSSVVRDTSVDTGRARGNWQISEDSPVTQDIDREDQAGSAPLNEIAGKVDQSAMDSDLYLSNNLSYIERLEEGYSGQAPEGMLRRNFSRITQIIRQAANNPNR